MSGKAHRSWYWGPQPGKIANEPYSGSKTGTRPVQYFDKARMEINNPSGDRSSQWFVTTGLLVAEMVSGKQQVGDKEFVQKRPAEIAVGGDGLVADPDAPTYTSFRPVASIIAPGANRAPNRTGLAATAIINRAGQVGSSSALGLYPGARLAAYVDITGHNIPKAMWDFLNLKGVVEQNGATLDGQTLANWVFVMGYPTTEPYWARIKINGIYYDALFQLYERRSLAYMPAFPTGWQVQMGNVGQHYYRWLYGGPLPTPLAPVGTPVPHLPPAVDATISPLAATVGTPLFASIKGFRPGEGIVSWFTAPDGTASDAGVNPQAAADGTIPDIPIPTLGLTPGVWAITFHGKASNHESIAYFSLSSPDITPTSTRPPVLTSTATQHTAIPTAAPTRYPTPFPQGTPEGSSTVPVVPTEPTSGLVLSVHPGYGPPDGQFTFTASGLTPNEAVQVTFTDPTGAAVYPDGSNNGRYSADNTGILSVTLVPSQVFPSAPTGTWLFQIQAQQSGLEGVVGFTLR